MLFKMEMRMFSSVSKKNSSVPAPGLQNILYLYCSGKWDGGMEKHNSLWMPFLGCDLFLLENEGYIIYYL